MLFLGDGGEGVKGMDEGHGSEAIQPLRTPKDA
jgi:hypothetical protein